VSPPHLAAVGPGTFGAWCLVLGASLELGAWVLELAHPDPLRGTKENSPGLLFPSQTIHAYLPP
jgi:hypothetical protein